MNRCIFAMLRIRQLPIFLSLFVIWSAMLSAGTKPLRAVIPAVQSVNPKPAASFQVASIRMNKSGSADSDFQPVVGGKLTINNVTLKTLIISAYHVGDLQISGGPGWIDSDRFDVNANASGDVSLQEALLMLQTLLVDRFQLVLHRETRDLTAYTLLSGKNPPKLKPAQGNGESGIKVLPIEGQKAVAQMVGKNMTMQHLADIIGNQLRAPVVDHTGLTGSFDFDIKLDASALPQGTNPELGALMVNAFREQLGLNIESTIMPGELLIIESAERPTGN